MTGERKKILAVDDNPENLIALRNTLKDLYEVYPAPSALEMFKLLEHIQPDLILLDVGMPEVNGYEAIKKLKNDDKNKDIPVIFLTSMIDEQSEIEGLKLGAVDYIRKPFVTLPLLQRINTHLSIMEQKNEIKHLLELKTKEVSLREAAESEAQNASRAKSEFLSHMSHEIRSPLNAVIGMINIATKTDNVQTIKNYLEKAENASKYVMGVINDILDMSKIEANKFELSFGEFDFRNMTATIIDVTSVRAKEKNQTIVVNVDEIIPQVLISDELRLSQVITNLLTNAIKFTPENGKVELSAEKTEGLPCADGEITLKITVTDSGIGISPEQQKKLFTSYNQADSSITKNFGGTGLGLAISKQIVELMRGTIWIESELGRGSKFIFTIKAKKGIGKALSAESDKSDETAFDFKDYTILAVEDVDINREIMSALLETTGITIDFAENGRVAISLFTEHPERYNLIFMDVHMPEMNGYEATRAIRAFEEKLNKNAAGNDSMGFPKEFEKTSGTSFAEGEITNDSMGFPNETPKLLLEYPKGIPIIAMTADVFKEDIEKCLSAGMNDHIMKPIVPKNVYAILKKYLGS
ncbi:MAG: response regulator [Treponema sp.]|jgi:signal transduction histidine kinase|nr:response regulator [Treponema sp.]